MGDSSPLPGRLKPGKLPNSLLPRMLAKLPALGPRVLMGPGVGEDAAQISFGAVTLIAKSDPITFASDLIGWYAVQVNANDVAASGGTPKWFMATVLLPEESGPSLAEEIFGQVGEAAAELGVEVIGGHTEVTIGLPRPIICGAMLGEAPASGAISTAGARPGDAVILTKGIAIEGASLLARELGERLRSTGAVDGQILDRAAGYLFDPGISVAKDARIAIEAGGVTSMHDPTEGGLSNALAEVSEASGFGMEIDETAATVLPEAEAMCRALDVDPWGLISSGALLITARPGTADNMVMSLRAGGCAPATIGRVTGPAEGVYVTDGAGRRQPLRTFERDEIARVFESWLGDGATSTV